jgi:hypothetical protein
VLVAIEMRFMVFRPVSLAERKKAAPSKRSGRDSLTQMNLVLLSSKSTEVMSHSLFFALYAEFGLRTLRPQD